MSMDNMVPKNQFIASYIASYLSGMYVKRSDEHMYTGKHPFTKPSEVPIEDAWFMAEVAWRAYEKEAKERTDNPIPDSFIEG